MSDDKNFIAHVKAMEDIIDTMRAVNGAEYTEALLNCFTVHQILTLGMKQIPTPLHDQIFDCFVATITRAVLLKSAASKAEQDQVAKDFMSLVNRVKEMPLP